MKKFSSALFWAFGVLFLTIVSVASFYIWKQPPAEPEPLFVSVGDLDAYAGGKRLVKASVVLEVGNKKAEALITERMARTKTTIANSFSDFSDHRIMTTDGKLELQERIRDDLNEHFGPTAVREVLFTKLILSIS